MPNPTPHAATLLCAMLVVGCAAGASVSPDQLDASRGDASLTRDAVAPMDVAPGDATTPPDTATSDAPHPDAPTSPESGLMEAAADAPTPADASLVDSPTTDTSSPTADAADASSGVCSAGTTRACTSSCGTTGTETCTSGAWGTCAPPAEVCNLMDDDCSGYCDDILGCRVGVDRSYNASSGQHFYTTTDSESSCCGYSVEQHDAWYLYATAQPGLVPFYRCSTASGGHLYTTDPACEGQTVEGSMGFIATAAVCGSVPLYRLRNPSSGDHLYTTSAAEVSAAEAGGYVSEGMPGYVWAADCGGPSCTWASPIQMVGSALTTVTGFPTAWYGFPLPAGTQTYSALAGSVSITNAQNLYSEVLFILEYLPAGCTAGLQPASTPEYGPPGNVGMGNFIVKSPTQGTVTVPINLTLPGGVPMSGCVLLGLNGGPVATPQNVISSANLSMTFTGPQSPAQGAVGVGGEMCFGQSGGCQLATTNDALSFASVTPIAQAAHLIALYGDISDSTFDGTASFGPLPAGAWTATNDFYVYHGADCSSFGVASGVAGPGNYYAAIPASATHLLSVPLSGSGIGVTQKQVYQALASMPLAAGDCFVTLWGLQGGGAFDNETQVTALVAP